MLKEITEWLEENFTEEIRVNVLQDNKYLVEEKLFIRDEFIEYLSAYNFSLHGIGSSEFYISLENGREFTIQVSNFSFDYELNLG